LPDRNTREANSAHLRPTTFFLGWVRLSRGRIGRWAHGEASNSRSERSLPISFRRPRV
jgi:hypothetical protein